MRCGESTRPVTRPAHAVRPRSRLQAAAVAFGDSCTLPIPEIVAIGGQSDGKSSLLEAFLGVSGGQVEHQQRTHNHGIRTLTQPCPPPPALRAGMQFRFNVREVEMGTRRPLIVQMVHDPTALEPRCRWAGKGGWRAEQGGQTCAPPHPPCSHSPTQCSNNPCVHVRMPTTGCRRRTARSTDPLLCPSQQWRMPSCSALRTTFASWAAPQCPPSPSACAPSEQRTAPATR